MDKVVHFEVPVDDESRAKAFYGSVFDWALNDMDMGEGQVYTLVSTVETDEKQMPTEPGAINGGMMRRSGEVSSPIITINVASINDSLKKVEAGGGATVRARTEVPNMGAYAYFKDTEGNVLGLWENLTLRRLRL